MFKAGSGWFAHLRQIKIMPEHFVVRLVVLGLMPLCLSGCIASVAASAVSAPIRAASKSIDVVSTGVDVLTTSQSESDAKRGKALRQREERLGRLSRNRDKAQRNCARDPGSDACDDLDRLNDDIDTELSRPY